VLGSAAPTVAGTVDAAEKTAADLILTSLQLVNEADVAAKQLIANDLGAIRTQTLLAFQDADAAALCRLENRVQQADDIELGKLALLGVQQNLGSEIIG
jgi:hypothetical protein